MKTPLSQMFLREGPGLECFDSSSVKLKHEAQGCFVMLFNFFISKNRECSFEQGLANL